MSTESILGKPHPDLHFSPDGKRVGYIVAGVAAGVGAIAGGTTWFIYSPQAAHLRERAAHLFGLKKTDNANWAMYFPFMMEDNTDPDKIRSDISAKVIDRIPVYQQRLPKPDPITKEPIFFEVAEFKVDALNLFPEARDFQTLEKLSMYASPLLHLRVEDGFRLSGVVIPEQARIPVKGFLQITHGSENYIPSRGIKTTTYGIVGLCAQTLTQLHLDNATDEHLASLFGKIVFVPLNEKRHEIDRGKDGLKLKTKEQKSFGEWVTDLENVG